MPAPPPSPVVYTLSASGDLIIGQRSAAGAATVSGTITVQGWLGNAGGTLDINLDDTPVAANANAHLYNGDQHAPLSGQSYNWSATQGYDAQGNLTGGVAEREPRGTQGRGTQGTQGQVSHFP
jgi:hypothetical protein